MKPWRTLRAGFAAGVVLGNCGPACATPAQLTFLRHAERPDTGSELNQRGRVRAAALVNLFTHLKRSGRAVLMRSHAFTFGQTRLRDLGTARGALPAKTAPAGHR